MAATKGRTGTLEQKLERIRMEAVDMAFEALDQIRQRAEDLAPGKDAREWAIVFGILFDKARGSIGGEKAAHDGVVSKARTAVRNIA